MSIQNFNRDAFLESLSYIDDASTRQAVTEFAGMVHKLRASIGDLAFEKLGREEKYAQIEVCEQCGEVYHSDYSNSDDENHRFCGYCCQLEYIKENEEQSISGLKPSNYTSHPMSSVSKEWEAEQIARNIMTILWRTGDEWRPLTWEEYCTERQKDGNFSKMEKPYFDRVISYCKSAEDADRFCSSWRK